ncbi:nuclear transport factor 2 family protein [Nocardioides mangrovi]|uniref:Nuclear transport factor 2 family protein n=1 Tax=Nocardioides mangrovi TaxID=2874580 RepID=A0ABS7U830_9ACTN|nr:nuclear transport factor 2 family protein [Nocardioides mangrovi]MBZ5737125.1 nuclear transport factor 2 family protein [Nocardioides mangrovi]
MVDEQVIELLRTNLHGVFGERDRDRRVATAARVYVEVPRFVDHDGSVSGRAAIVEQAQAVLDRVPDDFAFSEDGPAYSLGDKVALPWRFGPTSGPAVVRGLDLVTVVDGRIGVLEVLLAD